MSRSYIAAKDGIIVFSVANYVRPIPECFNNADGNKIWAVEFKKPKKFSHNTKNIFPVIGYATNETKLDANWNNVNNNADSNLLIARGMFYYIKYRSKRKKK